MNRTRTKDRPALADGLLEEEIKCASASLNASCGWAISLSEGISGFDDAFISVQQKLEELAERLKEYKFDEPIRRKLRNVLLEIRKYSRQMADESEPLRVDDIIENAHRMYELEKKLKKLVA
jgi:hypothetical protein